MCTPNDEHRVVKIGVEGVITLPKLDNSRLVSSRYDEPHNQTGDDLDHADIDKGASSLYLSKY